MALQILAGYLLLAGFAPIYILCKSAHQLVHVLCRYEKYKLAQRFTLCGIACTSMCMEAAVCKIYTEADTMGLIAGDGSAHDIQPVTYICKWQVQMLVHSLHNIPHLISP